MKFLKSIFTSSLLTVCLSQSSTSSVWTSLSQNASFSTFRSIAQSAGLQNFLSNTSNITILAPTNSAFNNLPPGLTTLLSQPTFKSIARSIILYHIADGIILTTDIPSNSTIQATSYVLGLPIYFSRNGTAVQVNDATIVTPDIRTSTGVIQGIDGVLNPVSGISDLFGGTENLSPDLMTAIVLLPPYIPSINLPF